MFPTEQQVYHRLRWDDRFDVKCCHVVITLRPSGTKRLPFLELDTEVVPWHRIVEFWIEDELAWSRPQRIDRLDELAARRSRSEPVAIAGVTIEPHRFERGAWVSGGAPGGVPDQPATRRTLRVVTWNLLFDRHDAELLHSDLRWQDALDRLAVLDADVIALCEVTPKIWERVLAQPWVRRYLVSHGPGAPHLAPFGQALLSRYPMLDASLIELVRGRSALIAQLAVGEALLGVAVVHLTSNRQDNAPALRASQLAAVIGHVRATPRDAWIVAGDFNADPEEHAELVTAARAIDLWDAARPGEPGCTFDVARNPIAAALTASGRSARLDRILAIANRVRLRPTGATLVGTEPGATGLPPSDHYGVAGEFAIEAIAGSELAHAPATRRTALAIIPPLEVWGAIQRVRCRDDRGFGRWPPHITLLHPFVDEMWLDRAARVVDDIAAGVAPFDLELDRIAAIDARGRTIVMLPARHGSRALGELHAAIGRGFGSLIDPARAYRPHLTIARDVDPHTLPALAVRWRVDRIAILRERDGRFETAHEAMLGSAARVAPAAPVTHDPDRSPARAVASIVAHVRDAVVELDPEVSVEPFGSAVYAPDHAHDVDLLVRTDAEPGQLAEILAFAATGGARTQLRGTLGGHEVDIVIVSRATPDERSLAGPADARRLVAHLRDHGRYAEFLHAWPHVQRFVAARALGGNGLGWLGSFGWALLLAVPLVHDEALCALPSGAVLAAWFHWLASLAPGARIGFDAIRDDDPAPLWLAAPSPPSRNVARGITSGTFAILRDEFRRAARLGSIDRIATDLAADPPPGPSVSIVGDAAIRGSYEGRFRGLLLDLEAAGIQIRPWGRFEAAGDRWSHRLSIEPTASAIAIIEAWLATFDPVARPRLVTNADQA